ncbi:3'-5' exoribonuclease domain-containing protein [Wohlfahrtiimonas chitiniclastica]|uniref:3'-5' exoribonuclease domain-containing protein n=1 Tax=Wohlfahrtiimonas chitiniclastica TaxID=400946 RepID=UPI001BCB2D82|nr:3'-5' exoribonuclease [Wohlfahrtiimonas chitiniclastica]MBS7837355.1 3'-5' exoribonuclease [Wohlfahrtiimonas chitiniclastica]
MRNNTNITHVVIDIETLGTVTSMLKKGTCPILQAAYTVVKYYPKDSQWRLMGGAGFTFSLGNQNEFDACADTVNWHMSKNNENYVSQLKASLDAQLDSADYFRQSLEAINIEAKNEGKELHFWSRGKDFDFPILTSYAMQNNFTYPFMRDFGFTRTHCLRDLEKFFGIDGKQFKNTNPHDAMHDADQEARVLCHWLNGGDHA